MKKRIIEGKTIVIYQAGSRNKRLGTFLMGLSLAGFLFFLSPFIGAKMSQQRAKGFNPLIDKEISRQPKVSPNQNKFDSGQARASRTEEPQEEEIKNFFLTIEKTGLIGAPVIRNVDPGNINEYKHYLKYGLVHAKTTAFPGQERMIFIFGHSTDYPWNISKLNALFYQIEKLETGDRIKIEYNGRHYLYHVFDKKIVAPDQVDFIEKQINKDILILQSCYPPGTTWQRVLVFARPSKMGALIY